MTKRAFLLIVSIVSSPCVLGDVNSTSRCESYSRTLEERAHRITAKHREANGIGYQTGYTSLEGFFSTSKTPSLLGFADVRAHVFNDSKKAYNLGVGLRGLSEKAHTVFGVNVFYDYRDARHRAFNQIGMGLEVLGTRWDLHVNGYIPVHNTKKKYRDEFLKFKGNNAIFTKRYEFAFLGCDFALGRELVRTKYWDLHAKLAGYWFNGEFGKNAGGGLFELSTNITRYLTLKGQASYDTLFRGVFQGEAAINIPFGRRFDNRDSNLSCRVIKNLEDRLVETVDRFEIIVTSTKRKKALALDPLTGQPLNFIFVDNTSSSLGTFESPFPTFQQAQAASAANNVIYVFPGDGTTNGMNSGITLKNNQKLIGSAAPLTVSTAFGIRTIPAQTLNTPVISNPSGSAVTLANNNTVSGFSVTSVAGQSGVFGNVVQGAEVSFNQFFQSATETSVLINSFTGNLNVHDNTFRGAGSGLTFTTTGNATGTVVNNLFACSGLTNAACQYTANSGNQIFIFDSNQFAPLSAVISSSLSGRLGLNITTTAPNMMVSVTNNVFTNFVQSASASAISFFGQTTSTTNLFIDKNVITNVTDTAIVVTASGTSTLVSDISNNILNNVSLVAGNSGIQVQSLVATGTNITLRLADNSVTNAINGDGYRLNSQGFPYSVQSPNGQLSGVQALNIGFINATGSFTFIPFTGPLF